MLRIYSVLVPSYVKSQKLISECLSTFTITLTTPVSGQKKKRNLQSYCSFMCSVVWYVYAVDMVLQVSVCRPCFLQMS